MSTPPAPSLPGLAQPPLCCCDCNSIRASTFAGGAGKAVFTHQEPGLPPDCRTAPVFSGSATSLLPIGGAFLCQDLVDAVISSCGGSFGCAATVTFPAGTTYGVGFRYGGYANTGGAVTWVMLRTDLTVDIFHTNPNFDNNCNRSGVCASIWGAYNVPRTLAPGTCRLSIPTVNLSLLQACNARNLALAQFRLDP